MRKMFLFLFSVCTLFISCKKENKPEPQQPQTQQNITAIDNAVTSFMSTYSIPGMQVAITRQGKLVYVKSYGTMSSADNTAVTNENLFRIASISKPVTGVGIMKLAESGRLTLDKISYEGQQASNQNIRQKIKKRSPKKERKTIHFHFLFI